MTVHACPFCQLRFAAHTERDAHVDDEHRDHAVRETREAVRRIRPPAPRRGESVLRGPW